MELYLETIADIIFGAGTLLFIYKVKTRTKMPFSKMLSLNPRKNLASVKLTLSELSLVAISFLLPLAILAYLNGFI